MLQNDDGNVSDGLKGKAKLNKANKEKQRSPRNKTLSLLLEERITLSKKLIKLSEGEGAKLQLQNTIFHGNFIAGQQFFPKKFAKLIIVDPPYNLTKDFHGEKFRKTSNEAYFEYIQTWLPTLIGLLDDAGSLYLCGNWYNSSVLWQALVENGMMIHNRITWQREKGRGAKNNWKNCSEDIWFATKTKNYYYNAAAVKLKRHVLAPYRNSQGPKDWQPGENGAGATRLTYASNFWDDITVPYWSMAENTEHPTQKSEKLLAKIILASSAPGDMVFDPFLGSGSTAVTAYKLQRQFCGVEIVKEYCLWALCRLEKAKHSSLIQGYKDGVFSERNSEILKRKFKQKKT